MSYVDIQFIFIYQLSPQQSILHNGGAGGNNNIAICLLFDRFSFLVIQTILSICLSYEKITVQSRTPTSLFLAIVMCLHLD